MNPTYELRLLVSRLLSHTGGAAFFRNASANAEYPYKTFSFERVDYEDPRLYDLCIDLYDRGDDSRLDEIADAIEKELDGLNCPSDGILPTFFLDIRYPVEEKDKELYHTQMHLQVHLYDNKEVKNA